MGYKCPFCGEVMSVTSDTSQSKILSFNTLHHGILNASPDDRAIEFLFFKCPNCLEISIYAKGWAVGLKDLFVNIYPCFQCEHYPDYVPEAIRVDYEEACAISGLSPKASATLSRRCLQGMIRDFWGIKKNNLSEAINELKDKIPADLWQAIDSLRKIGNIGAHMEKDINLIVDIDPEEAKKLIALIELLMKEWYINKHQREALFDDILSISSEKQDQRKLGGT